MNRVHDFDVPTQPVPYGQVIAANVRAARARAEITQTTLARRMRRLGARWHFQTVGAVERGERPVSLYEAAALALALDTSFDVIALPPAGQALMAFDDNVVPSQRLSIVDDSVQWGGKEGEDIKISPPSVVYREFELRMAKEQNPQTRVGLEALRDELHQAQPPGEDED
jgi:transcriptional regulator with XRE-family HTH domain